MVWLVMMQLAGCNDTIAYLKVKLVKGRTG